MKPDVPISRRRALQAGTAAAGAVVAGGVGLSAVGSVGAAATNVSITSNPVYIEDERGEIDEVYMDPEFTFEWANLDDAVGAVSIFIEAKVEGRDDGPNGGWFPLHRSEPVLLPGDVPQISNTKPGTSGKLILRPFSTLSENRVDGKGWGDGTNDQGHLYLAHVDGTPDYSGADEAYLQGGNVWSGTIPDSDKLVNGEYGTAAHVDDFEVPPDGENVTTPVQVRYTFQFIRYSLDHFTQITGVDPVAKTDGTIGAIRTWLQDRYDDQENRWIGGALSNKPFIADVKPEDITVIGVPDKGDPYTFADDEELSWETNQKIAAMTGPGEDWHDGDYGLVTRSANKARGYDGDQDDIPVIQSTTDQFGVNVTNLETEDMNSDGTANNGGS